MGALNWLQLALALPVVLWCGWPFFVRGWSSVVHRSPNMFTLIAIGVGAAFLYSVAATIAPAGVPRRVPRSRRGVEPYFDSRRGDRGPGPARTGSGTAGPFADRGGDPRAARPAPQDSPGHPGRERGRYPSGGRAGR